MSAWEKNVRRVTPYVPGEQPREAGFIKLNTNENPYPPSPAVQRALEGAKASELRLDPDPAATDLTEAIADYHRVGREQVFVGVGSDEVLAMSFMTFFQGETPILFPDITYSFYDVWAGLFGISYETCPLDQNFHIRVQDYCGKNGGIVIPNPNAPTGLAESRETMEKIVAANLKNAVSREGGIKKLMLAGTMGKEEAEAFSASLASELEGVSLSAYERIVFQAAALEDLDSYDGVLFLEKKGASYTKLIKKEKDLADDRNIRVLGAVVL